MDPTTLMQLLAHLRQQGQAPGMPQGQMPPMGQGQLPSMGQMPPQGQPQGQLPPMTPPQGGMGQGMGPPSPSGQRDHHHGHGGLNPWMMLSPLGGLLAGGGGGMGALAPMFGLAGLFGSKLFK